MPKKAKDLTALEVGRLRHPGSGGNAVFAVGTVPGLLLQCTPSGARTWLLRTLIGTKRRSIGLGGYPGVSLADAIRKAREAKDKIQFGVDPVEERKAARAALAAAQARGMTFKAASEKCLAARLKGLKNAKHQQQWQNTLDTYAMPEIGAMLVSEITRADVLRVLQPIWETKTETASRLRGRIETVLDWAAVNGHRSGDNPARLKGNLDHDLAKKSAVAGGGNHPAVQLDDAARWLAALQKRGGSSARALEFQALTACRSGEVRGATWDEIDLDKALWIIPSSRMKAGKEHRIPLPADAVALLKSLSLFRDNPLVFPAPKGAQMSDMALSAVMKRIHKDDVKAGRTGFVDRVSKRPAVPHALRSVFRDFIAERTSYPGDLAETALAHRISNSVEAAYRRGDMIEKRRGMMQHWADFLAGRKADGNVLQFAGAQA